MLQLTEGKSISHRSQNGEVFKASPFWRRGLGGLVVGYPVSETTVYRALHSVFLASDARHTTHKCDSVGSDFGQLRSVFQLFQTIFDFCAFHAFQSLQAKHDNKRIVVPSLFDRDTFVLIKLPV